MNYSSNEVKVGAVVVAGFTVLVGFIVAIIGTNLSEHVKEYRTYLKSVPGIVEGSLVKFGGMDVGSVTAVQLPDSPGEEPMIELRLKVDDKTPVKVDSRAYVTSIGIMANQHIEISPGTPDAELLPSGSVLRGKEVLTLMQMAEPLGEMSGELQDVIGQFADLFNDENRAHLNSVIVHLDEMVSEGGSRFNGLADNLEKLTANLAEVSGALNELMASNRGHLDDTMVHLQKTTKETSELIADLRKSLKQFEGVVSANGSSIVEILENFQFASQNLEEFTRTVKERPWLLVRKAAPPKRELP